MIAIPDEMLMAYADNELSAEESKALEALLQHDAQLRARLEPFVETRSTLASAFEQTLHEPVPDRLIAAISRAPAPRTAAKTVTFGDRVRAAIEAAQDALFPHGFSAGMAAGAAALLIVGAGAGWFAGRQASSSSLIDVAMSDQGGLVASGTLAKVLERNPSGAGSQGGEGETVVPVLSFRSKDDGVCREYRVAGQTSKPDFAGVACRATDGTWRVALHVETGKQPGGANVNYQTASGASVPAVEAAVDALITGDAFGKDDELKFLKDGWPTPAGKTGP